MLYEESIKIWRAGIDEEQTNRFFMKFTYCSNKIENNEARLRDVEAVFNRENITHFKERKKIIRAIENHRDLCQDIFKLNKGTKEKLSMEIIEMIYFVLTGNKVGREEYGSLNKLAQDINNMEIDDCNALEVVSYFYCCFQAIGSYDGRVGRMLLNYLLVVNNLPPIILFYYDTEEYYLALEYFNETQEIDKMVKFLDDQAYKTWVKDYNLKLKSLKDFLD
jgi:Fic family protein